MRRRSLTQRLTRSDFARRFTRRQRRHPLRGALEGAVAGALATWLMDRVTTYLYDREGSRAREREDRARQGRTAYEMAARKMARAFGRTLDDEEQAVFGNGIHWLLGIGAGAVYGAMGPTGRTLSLARGLRFGTGFWIFMDETVTPALGLTPGPRAFPWQTHVRGLAGHAAYGLAVESAVRAMRRLT